MGMTIRQEAPGFHLSFNVGADFESVVANRKKAFEALGIDAGGAVFAEQVHGSEIGAVTSENCGRGSLDPKSAIPGCDALITQTPGVSLCITVADCLPIFINDPANHAIGLAHSGWRGTAGNILRKTFDRMRLDFGTVPARCLVSIGPGISGAGYEVDQKVRDAFPESENQAMGFKPSRPGHWKLDLTEIVMSQALEIGVKVRSLSQSPWRTDTHPELFQSHRLENGCPRMLCFLRLNDIS